MFHITKIAFLGMFPKHLETQKAEENISQNLSLSSSLKRSPPKPKKRFCLYLVIKSFFVIKSFVKTSEIGDLKKLQKMHLFKRR
jgi:hypothetical protein